MTERGDHQQHPADAEFNVAALIETAVTANPEVRAGVSLVVDTALTLGILRGVRSALAQPGDELSMAGLDPLTINDGIINGEATLPQQLDALVDTIESATVAALGDHFSL